MNALLESAFAAHEQERRQQLANEFCRWLETEFGVENYKRRFRGENITVVIDDLMFVPAGNNCPPDTALVLLHCAECRYRGDERRHPIAEVGSLAKLGALVVRGADGALLLECRNCRRHNAHAKELQNNRPPAATQPPSQSEPADERQSAPIVAANHESCPVEQRARSADATTNQNARRRRQSEAALSVSAGDAPPPNVARRRARKSGRAEKPARSTAPRRRQKLRAQRLGAKLLSIRQRQGLTQGALLPLVNPTEKNGANRARVSQYEKGLREPSVIEMLNYAELAGVALEILLDDRLDLPN